METHIEFTWETIVVPMHPAATGHTGAEVEFRGIVRETERGKPIAGLEYSAYQPMAQGKIRRILNQLCETWPCQEVWVIHRLGWVPICETSLYVRVHASHREAAFRLCMEFIDLLKRDVPIWKGPAEPEPPLPE